LFLKYTPPSLPRWIFGPKTEKVTGRRESYNEELHNLYPSYSGGKMEETEKARREEISLETGVNIRIGNTEMDLKETAREVVDWIQLAYDRSQWWVLVKTIINILVS
jgi:hypothetical protein